MATVHVLNGRQKKLIHGHPWVYGNEIDRIEGTPENGDLVETVDFRGRFLGYGLYNANSLLRVRLLTHDRTEVTEELIRERVRQAVRARGPVLARPGTDSCRLVYGEADRLPGVICDRFGPVTVLQILTLGMEKYTDVIADTLLECVKPACLYLANDDRIREKEGMTCYTREYFGTLPEQLLIEENGLHMQVDIRGGQKTGSFLDQKANHQYLRQFAKGARVLDCFSYAGGFALNAAAAGAAIMGGQNL